MQSDLDKPKRSLRLEIEKIESSNLSLLEKNKKYHTLLYYVRNNDIFPERYHDIAYYSDRLSNLYFESVYLTGENSDFISHFRESTGKISTSLVKSIISILNKENSNYGSTDEYLFRTGVSEKSLVVLGFMSRLKAVLGSLSTVRYSYNEDTLPVFYLRRKEVQSLIEKLGI